MGKNNERDFRSEVQQLGDLWQKWKVIIIEKVSKNQK
jgi:hypothetical protein